MSCDKLDLRQKASATICIDEGVSYQPSINGVLNLDSGYTLTINGITKTVGNGLSLGSNSIIIEISSTDFTSGIYKGEIVSDSTQAGVYLRIGLTIECYAN